MAKQELLATIRDRYRASSRKDKSRILDEFSAVTGHHRKHGIRLLSQCEDVSGKTGVVKGRRIYDEAVREAVILAWEASDRICGKRLKAALPHLVESTEPSWPPGLGPRGERASVGCQRRHSGPAAQTRSRHGGRPEQTPAEVVSWSQYSGAYLRGLESAPTWFPGN